MGWFQPQPEEAVLRPGATSGTNYGTAASPPAASNLRRRSALVVALFSSLGGFLFGVDIGYISGVEVMASFRAIFALGALAAASPPASEALMRAMSRRSALVAGAATFCVGAIIQGLSFNVPAVLVGRFVSGASIGVLSTNVPVYMSELAAADERGKLVAFYQLAITLGIMMAFWFSFFLQDAPHGWRISVLAQLLPGAVLAIGMTGMPDSPCGLVAQKRRGEALKVLQEIRPEGADVDLELREIEAAHAEEMATGEATWAQFCSGPVAKIGAVGVTSMLLQQLGGMNVFMFYGPRVCEAIGLSGFLFTAIAGMVNFLATFPAILLVDRYGRARLLQFSAVGMMVSCFGLAMVGNFAMVCTPGEEQCAIQSPLAKYTAAGCIFFFIANFAYGWGPVPWVLCSEIFPMKYRAKGVGLTTSMSWLGTFIIGYFPPMLISSIGFNTFWVFFAFNSAALGFALWLPETRGRSLDQVTAVFYRKFERGEPSKLIKP
jgi:sugar porter (SP) family MFS transporter